MNNITKINGVLDSLNLTKEQKQIIKRCLINLNNSNNNESQSKLIAGNNIKIENNVISVDIANWATKSDKPTYTAEEVGAMPNDTKIPTKLSELINDEPTEYLLTWDMYGPTNIPEAKSIIDVFNCVKQSTTVPVKGIIKLVNKKCEIVTLDEIDKNHIIRCGRELIKITKIPETQNPSLNKDFEFELVSIDYLYKPRIFLANISIENPQPTSIVGNNIKFNNIVGTIAAGIGDYLFNINSSPNTLYNTPLLIIKGIKNNKFELSDNGII